MLASLEQELTRQPLAGVLQPPAAADAAAFVAIFAHDFNLLYLRQLLRARAYLRARPDDARGALARATSASMLTIPPAARETARQLLVEATTARGLPASCVPPLPSSLPSLTHVRPADGAAAQRRAA